jgi:glycosyltransferase involved in cell wall biosynthesis
MEHSRLPDLVCLSHLRWNFVFQRPQHLSARFARERRVFFFEEPLPAEDDDVPRLDVRRTEEGVVVAVPRLPPGLDLAESERIQGELLKALLREHSVDAFVAWYWTPMALGFSADLEPLAVAFDCMDELSLFRDASPLLLEREADLIGRADVMFTGGMSLYEHKRSLHPNVHGVPSSVDVAHFAAARTGQGDPADQAPIPHPRLGFFGVIDERFDIALLRDVAAARPDWHWVMLGPTAKIDPADLPRRPNIHWLGSKPYRDLPRYLGGWDVGVMPFARNEATRFISPTKTPEFLAAGLPVVSTAIRDVVTPYGDQGLVCIADEPERFVVCVESLLRQDRQAHVARADRFLAATSWDRTWARMKSLLDAATPSRRLSAPAA